MLECSDEVVREGRWMRVRWNVVTEWQDKVEWENMVWTVQVPTALEEVVVTGSFEIEIEASSACMG